MQTVVLGKPDRRFLVRALVCLLAVATVALAVEAKRRQYTQPSGSRLAKAVKMTEDRTQRTADATLPPPPASTPVSFRVVAVVTWLTATLPAPTPPRLTPHLRAPPHAA